MATPNKLIYEIVVNSNADESFKKLDSSVRSFNNTMKTVSNTMNLFKGILAGYLSIQGAKQFLELSDAMSELKVNLKLLTGDMATAVAVQEELFTVSNKHGIAVQDLTKAYIGLAPTFTDLGKTQGEIVTFTDNLVASYKLLGENSGQAMASVTQLSEAFKTGKVDMGLMNQVLGSNRLLMQAVAKEMGVTEKQLRTMAKTGKVSAEQLFAAVIKAGDEWQKKAAELPTGIGEALTILGNEFAKLAEKFTPVVEVISKGIILIAENFDILSTAAIALGTYALMGVLSPAFLAIGLFITATFIPAIVAATSGMVGFSIVAVTSIQSIGTALSAAIASNPIGILVTLFTTAGYLIYKNWEGIKLFFIELFTVTLPNAWDSSKILFLEFINAVETGFKLFGNEMISVYNKTIGKITGKTIEPFKFDSSKFKTEIKEIEAAMDARQLKFDKYVLSLDEANAKTADLLNKPGIVVPKLPEPPVPIKAAKEEKPIKDDSILAKLVENYAQLTKKRNESIELWGEESNAVSNVGKEIEKLNIGVNQMSLDANDAAGGFLNGLKEAANEIPTIADGFKEIGKSAFNGMADSLTSFITKGKADFGKFFQDISAMLVKLGIQKALVAAIGSFADGGVFENGKQLAFANGGVFENNNVTPFAKGGVVTKPTIFPFANGIGLMGEAGPEAIMPLKRHNGKLGVEASGAGNSGNNITNVTVINNAKDTETETRETTAANGTRNIEVFILSKVKEDMGKGGFDKTFAGNFGINRQGNR